MGMVVEGKSKNVSATPVIQAAAYASGDQLGSLFQLVNALDDSSGTGGILSLIVLDKSKQKASIELMLFSEKPVVTSTDNTPVDIADSEMAAKYIGSVAIPASSYTDLANSSVSTVTQVALLLNAVKDQNTPTGRDVWALLVSRGTPTYTSTSDLVLKVGVIQD